MNASPSAGAAGRSTSVAHFLAPHWGRIAERLAPVIDRDNGDSTAPTALLCVPDAGAAVELAGALRAARATLPRILPVTDASRAARVLKTYGAPIVIATPADAERLLAASALPLDAVQVIALVGAEEFHADQLAHVMASVPKEARRVLIASEATPMVEVLLERYFHKAHRLADDSAAEVAAAALQYLCVRGSSAAQAVPGILDDLDPPSAVVIAADADPVRAALAASGYPSDAPLVRVSDGDAPQHVALVIFAGLPAPAAFERAMAAQPGRAVALISPRQLGALRKMAGAGSVTPYTTRRATSAARAQEERMRGELRSVLATAYPSHEIMALEPLLAEFDGVELAGAALRLLDAARASAATPAVVAPAATAAAARSPRPARTAHDDRPARDAREPRGDRPARPREGFPLREPGPGEKPRFVDRTVRRDADRAPRRSFGDGPKRSYGDGPKRSYGDGPKRSYGDGPKRSFGDRPRGAQGDKPRGRFGDKPRGAGPRRPRGE